MGPVVGFMHAKLSNNPSPSSSEFLPSAYSSCEILFHLSGSIFLDRLLPAEDSVSRELEDLLGELCR